MKLTVYPYRLALRHTFALAHETRKFQPGLIVELCDGKYSGYGEASAIAYYGKKLEHMLARLQALRPLIEQAEWDTPEAFWKQMYPHVHQTPFLQCALDEAAHDLYGKRLGKPLYEIWGLKPENLPVSNYTIGLDTLKNMLAKMREMPWPVYKIKLGTDHDLEIVRALRRESDAVFRVDANTAWTAEQTVAYAEELKTLGVEFIEQPLKPDAPLEEQRFVYEQSALPIIADESCQTEDDVARCAGFFHGVNVKLMKCGGLTPARRMLRHARNLGLKTMVGCMTESSVGISAIAQLLPLIDYVDMDGALLLKTDVASGVKLSPQGVEYPDLGGSGVVLHKERLGIL